MDAAAAHMQREYFASQCMQNKTAMPVSILLTVYCSHEHLVQNCKTYHLCFITHTRTKTHHRVQKMLIRLTAVLLKLFKKPWCNIEFMLAQ